MKRGLTIAEHEITVDEVAADLPVDATISNTLATH
jgi:hypothetical protein